MGPFPDQIWIEANWALKKNPINSLSWVGSVSMENFFIKWNKFEESEHFKIKEIHSLSWVTFVSTEKFLILNELINFGEYYSD